jgi:integrase
MKAKKPHRVPLSQVAIELLRDRPNGEPGDLVFASSRSGRQLSDMAMTATVRRLDVDAVPHGLARATFKTWSTVTTAFPREVIEAALAHALENKTEGAYWRADYEKRIRLMTAWAEFLTTPARATSVTPIRKGRAVAASSG